MGTHRADTRRADRTALSALDTAVFLARAMALRVMIDIGFRAPR